MNFILQGYFTNGYFLESPDKGSSTYLKTIEKKKLLSGVESLGLLSKAEKAGLTLSTVIDPFVSPLWLSVSVISFTPTFTGD